MLFPLVVFLLAITPIACAAIMLSWIDRQAKQKQAVVRIFTVDLFSLMFMVQLPSAIFLRTADFDDRVAVVLMIVFSVLMFFVWWVTIRAVSKAGITRTASRAWISLFVIPVAYVGSFAIIGVAIRMANPGSIDMLVYLSMIEIVLVIMLVLSMIVTKRELRKAELVSQQAPDASVVSPV